MRIVLPAVLLMFGHLNSESKGTFEFHTLEAPLFLTVAIEAALF